MNLPTEGIRALNDELRRNLPNGHAVMTAGIATLGPEAVARIVKTIAVYGEVVQFSKGCGFIQPQGGAKIVFVYISISAAERARPEQPQLGGPVGRGRDHRVAKSFEDFARDRVVRHAHGNGVEARGRKLGDRAAGRFGQNERQRSRPQGAMFRRPPPSTSPPI